MIPKNSVYHQKNFLNKEELGILSRSVLKNFNPSLAKNLLDLDDIENVSNKVYQNIKLYSIIAILS